MTKLGLKFALVWLWLTTPIGAKAEPVSIGEAEDCTVAVPHTPDGSAVHVPRDDVSHEPEAPDFGLKGDISIDLTFDLPAPAPAGSKLDLGEAVISGAGQTVKLNGTKYRPDPTVCPNSDKADKE